jgi:iron complex transport system substrate-binding protein
MRSLLFALLLLGGGMAHASQDCPTIVSQSPYITHTLEWMGLKHCIIGTSRYEDLGLPQTGGVLDPDAEAIALLQPDIFLSSDWITEEKAREIAPVGSRVYRLHGFQTLSQIEDNLSTIARAVGLDHPRAHARRFHALWQQKLVQLRGGHKKVLLLSACSGNPYSFGRNTWLYDLFTRAGFRVVESHDSIRLMGPDQIGQHIDKLKPELVFVFEPRAARQCRLITPKTPVRILALDGEKLLDPSPDLLEGLDELINKQSAWKSL